jgi:hypothetical protein
VERLSLMGGGAADKDRPEATSPNAFDYPSLLGSARAVAEDGDE